MYLFADYATRVRCAEYYPHYSEWPKLRTIGTVIYAQNALADIQRAEGAGWLHTPSPKYESLRCAVGACSRAIVFCQGQPYPASYLAFSIRQMIGCNPDPDHLRQLLDIVVDPDRYW